MVMVIEEWMLIAVVGMNLLLFIASISMFMKTRQYPDVMTHMKADIKKDAVCRVHFPGRQCKDYIAEIDKAEKEIGTNYWRVPSLGIKFKPGPEDIEFIEGSIPCVNYYEKMPIAITTRFAAALSQLRSYLAKIGLPIDGDEKEILYLMQEIQKKPAERAIDNARINSIEMREKLRRYLDSVKAKKHELERLTLESSVFTYQTAMKALNDSIAHTSYEVNHSYEVMKAAILRSEDNKRKDWITYAIVAFILCIGAAGFVIVVKG